MQNEKLLKMNEQDWDRFDELATEAGLNYKVVHSIKNDYHLKHSRYYVGSQALYKENVYFIRQLPKFRSLYEAGIRELDLIGVKIDGMPRGSGVSNPTEQKVIRLLEIEKNIDIIDAASKTIPEEYRYGVLDHVIEAKHYYDSIYDFASVQTWKKWVQKFVYEVAIRRGQRELIKMLRAEELDSEVE